MQADPGFAGRVLLIVPAFDEIQNVSAVIADARANFPAAEIVVVDDGSSDGTGAFVRDAGVAVLQLPFNLGIGAAVQTGLLYASQNDYAVAVQFDGDGQHRADQVPKLIAALDEGFDVAIGSRFLGSGTYRPPFSRRLGMRVLNFVSSLFLTTRITDSTSGFRAYNKAAIDFLARHYPHDYPEPETLVTLSRNDFWLKEVAVEMRERRIGSSSITLGRSVYYMCKVIVAILAGATRQTFGRSHESTHSDHRHPRQRAGDAARISVDS